MSETLDHIPVSLGGAGMIHKAIIGGYDKDRQVWISALDLLQHFPPIEPIQVQIQEYQIRF